MTFLWIMKPTEFTISKKITHKNGKVEILPQINHRVVIAIGEKQYVCEVVGIVHAFDKNGKFQKIHIVTKKFYEKGT